jgi:hypothetical protein
LASYDRIIENRTFTGTLRLEGDAYDNTLVRNVTIRDVDGAGIFLRNVENVRIESVTILNASGDGIRLSSEGSTSNVVIVDSVIRNVGEDGINAGQRPGVDHTGLEIIDSTISGTGLNGSRDGLRHGLYIQSSDYLIEGNTIERSTDGNGISVRASGIIRDNFVDTSGKSGIAYFADHPRGAGDRLVIEGNTVVDSGVFDHRSDIDLLSITGAQVANAVRTVVVRNNVLTDDDGTAVNIGRGYGSVVQTGNVVVAEAEARADDVAGTVVRGDLRANTLLGGLGDDTLVGGGGADVFVIRAGNGSDTVADFSLAGGDRVRIEDYGYDAPSDLVPLARQVGDDTVLRLSADETLTLESVALGHLTASDFLFG